MDKFGNFTIEDEYWCIAGEQVKSGSKQAESKVFRKIAEKKISESEEQQRGHENSYLSLVLEAWRWKYRYVFEKREIKREGLSLLDMSFLIFFVFIV